MPAEDAIVSEPVSMREAQKAFSRDRIRDAALVLFHANGYAATTIDQIAAAAGTRRSTLYTHFRDKEAILGAIGSQLGGPLVAVMADLPGPIPNRAAIDTWIGQVEDVVVRERMPTILLSDLGYMAEVPTPVLELGARLMDALAGNVLAFRRATEGDRKAHAWATIVLRELCWSCLQHDPAQPADHGQAELRSVVGDLLEMFVAQTR